MAATTYRLQQNVKDLREQRIAEDIAAAASLNPAFSDNVLAEEVRKLGEASEERARLHSEEAQEAHDSLLRQNLIREKQHEQEKQAAVERYHSAQQTRDQKTEAEVSRRFRVLSESQTGPENVWAMNPERLRFLAETASMAKPFLSQEEQAALDVSTDPFLQTQQLAAQVPERQQVPNTQQHPETFPDGSLVQVKDNGDGTLEARLITGERFTGDPLTITRKIGEANVHTKRWARGQRAEQPQQSQQVEQPQPANPNSAVSFAPDGTAQIDLSKMNDLGRWQLDELGKSLGYADGAEMVADQLALRSKTQDLEQRLKQRGERDYILETSTSFLASAPDFPNTDESIAALEQVINQNGWEWNRPNMEAAHALAVRQGLYQPVPVEYQNANWEQTLRESNRRPTPPPMLNSNSPDASPRELNPWEEPLPQMRARLIREQLGETDGRR